MNEESGNEKLLTITGNFLTFILFLMASLFFIYLGDFFCVILLLYIFLKGDLK